MAITIVTAADSTDLTTLARVKTFLGISTTDHDTLLSMLIKMASNAAVKYCNRNFAQQRIQETVRSVGSNQLYVSNPHVTALHSVHYKGVAVDTADYYLENACGIIEALESGTLLGSWYDTGRDLDYTVAYTYGYVLPSFLGVSDSDITLPLEIEQAVIGYVKTAFNARNRDELLKSREVPEVYKESYFGSKDASVSGYSKVFTDALEAYRKINI